MTVCRASLCSCLIEKLKVNTLRSPCLRHAERHARSLSDFVSEQAPVTQQQGSFWLLAWAWACLVGSAWDWPRGGGRLSLEEDMKFQLGPWGLMSSLFTVSKVYKRASRWLPRDKEEILGTKSPDSIVLTDCQERLAQTLSSEDKYGPLGWVVLAIVSIHSFICSVSLSINFLRTHFIWPHPGPCLWVETFSKPVFSPCGLDHFEEKPTEL